VGAGDDDDEEDENASGFHPTLDFVCWALALGGDGFAGFEVEVEAEAEAEAEAEVEEEVEVEGASSLKASGFHPTLVFVCFFLGEVFVFAFSCPCPCPTGAVSWAT